MEATFMKAAVATLHRGYQLKASACPAHGGVHAAGLVIERPGRAPEAFAALDYFFDVEQALKYATSWGRIRVDMKTGGPLQA
jgi:hypothetical protein